MIMPVCLNCGKDIPGGRKYCDDCASALKDRALEYLPEIKEPVVKINKPRRRMWFIITCIVLTVLFVGLAYALMSMFPEEEISEMQAERCRARISQVEKAVANYVDSEGELPPDGRVTKNHRLVTEGYLAVPPRCPTTTRYYVIKYENGEAVVTCDSKLEGHELE